MHEPLLIDIQTILKMCRFVPTFLEEFKKLDFIDLKQLENYVETTSVVSKNELWGSLSILERLPEVNKIIKLWRNSHSNYQNIERVVKKMAEGPKADIVGRLIKSNKHKEVMKNIKDFHYNGISVINKENERLYFFY